MNTTFREYAIGQPFVLPPDLRDRLLENHMALFVAHVVGQLDLSAIYRDHQRDGRGQPQYDPQMMVTLLLYAYCVGRPSSRVIEPATYEDVAFSVLAANQHPDHETICEFRRRHLSSLAGLFLQVLQLCKKAGLVKLGHLALDGTKLKADASKHKAMSYKRMLASEKRLKKEIEALLHDAEATDQREDALYAKSHRGDELPAELGQRESRLKKIREAKEALEQAEIAADVARKKLELRKREEEETGRKKPGRPPKIPHPTKARPHDKAQRDFMDRDSRIMRDSLSCKNGPNRRVPTRVMTGNGAPERRRRKWPPTPLDRSERLVSPPGGA